MGRLFFLMGKSASGKDTIYKKLINDRELSLKPVVLYTTRPLRDGETQGKEYYFVKREEMEKIEKEGRIIEKRTYHTMLGDWDYFTADDGQIDLEKNNYLIMGVPDSCESMQNYFGKDRVVPLYLEVDDGDRLMRAIKREKERKKPQYEEMCRRFLADAKDYEKSRLEKLSIHKTFHNNQLEPCFQKIKEEILHFM